MGHIVHLVHTSSRTEWVGWTSRRILIFNLSISLSIYLLNNSSPSGQAVVYRPISCQLVHHAYVGSIQYLSRGSYIPSREHFHVLSDRVGLRGGAAAACLSITSLSRDLSISGTLPLHQRGKAYIDHCIVS